MKFWNVIMRVQPILEHLRETGNEEEVATQAAKRLLGAGCL